MKANSITETYGELLSESITRLIPEMSLTGEDIFLDMGSGLGKVVLQIFSTTKTKESIGIEINPKLHALAVAAREEMIQGFTDNPNHKKIRFIQGDFMEAAIDGTTVMLIASPCYSPTMLYKLGARIDETTSIRLVISLRPMATLARLTFKKIIRVEGSWDTTLCYIYEA